MADEPTRTGAFPSATIRREWKGESVMAWLSKVSIKHLLTSDETLAGVQRDMNAIADVITASTAFSTFPRAYITKMRNIPVGDEIVTPCDYANRLIDKIYDYADAHRIWID